jgi:hypothetical protein
MGRSAVYPRSLCLTRLTARLFEGCAMLSTRSQLTENASSSGAISVDNYTLASHVYVCDAGDGIVFLDLPRQRYIGLASSYAGTLRSYVRNWPWKEESPCAMHARPDESEIVVLEGLRQAGLLTASVEAPQHLSCSLSEPQEAAYAMLAYSERIQPTAAHYLRFFLAFITTVIKMRTCTLEQIATRLLACKRGRQSRKDLAEVKSLTRCFLRIRPWFYTARKACLFDSLTLLEYLRGYEIYPTLVLGARAKPFLAHSWVQLDSLVLNESVYNARQFARILAI